MALNLSEEPELYYAIDSKVLYISKAAGSASSSTCVIRTILRASVQTRNPDKHC